MKPNFYAFVQPFFSLLIYQSKNTLAKLEDRKYSGFGECWENHSLDFYNWKEVFNFQAYKDSTDFQSVQAFDRVYILNKIRVLV